MLLGAFNILTIVYWFYNLFLYKLHKIDPKCIRLPSIRLAPVFFLCFFAKLVLVPIQVVDIKITHNRLQSCHL